MNAIALSTLMVHTLATITVAIGTALAACFTRR
jgi:hypothetical protein